MKRRFSYQLSFIFLGIIIGLVIAFGFGILPIPQGLMALGGSRTPTNTLEPVGTLGTGVQPLPEVELPRIDSPGFLMAQNPGDRFMTPDELNNIAVYEARNEGVVNITTETIAHSLFFEPIPQEGSTGSGSIIDPRGYILTNNHVIRNAVRVFVILASGTRLEAEIVGVDPENDLAVLRIDPKGEELTVIPLGNSNNLRIGQKVLAIGNPFSFDRTLTTGVVSGLGRPIRTNRGTIINDMIQTDASINPGNSGGPLLDNQGNLIGVNTMIFTPTGGSVGVGFAVPVETARRVIPDLIEFGRVQRGWIDIVPIQLFPQLVNFANLPVSQGILISQLQPGGRAEAAGLRGGNTRNAVRSGATLIYLGGDVIVQIDSTPVASIADIFTALESRKPGDRVTVHFIRNNERMQTQVELVPRPERYM